MSKLDVFHFIKNVHQNGHSLFTNVKAHNLTHIVHRYTM